jgi:phage-related protein
MPIFRPRPPRFVGGRQPYAAKSPLNQVAAPVLVSVAASARAMARGTATPPSLKVSPAVSARAAARGTVAPTSLRVSAAISARVITRSTITLPSLKVSPAASACAAAARGAMAQSSIAIPVAAFAKAIPRGSGARTSVAVPASAFARARATAGCSFVALAVPTGLSARAMARGRATPLTSTGAPAHAFGRATARGQSASATAIGAAVHSGFGRALSQGTAQVAWFVGPIPIRASASGAAARPKGRAAPTTIVWANSGLALVGRAFSFSLSGGVGIPIAGGLFSARGSTRPFGRIGGTGDWSVEFSISDFGVSPLTIFATVGARGRANPRGRTSVVAAVSTSGLAVIRARVGGTVLARAGLRGRAIPRGTVTRLFAGAAVARGFVAPRGRIAAVTHVSVTARGMAVARSQALDPAVFPQQGVVGGGPPLFTIWQRLSSVYPSSQLQEKPRILRNTFGDGYGQSIPDGMTGVVRTMTLTWENVDRTEADQIVQFLANNIGRPISFVAPREHSPRNWLAMDWKRTSPQPNADNITVTFEDRPFVEMILGL